MPTLSRPWLVKRLASPAGRDTSANWVPPNLFLRLTTFTVSCSTLTELDTACSTSSELVHWSKSRISTKVLCGRARTSISGPATFATSARTTSTRVRSPRTSMSRPPDLACCKPTTLSLMISELAPLRILLNSSENSSAATLTRIADGRVLVRGLAMAVLAASALPSDLSVAGVSFAVFLLLLTTFVQENASPLADAGCLEGERFWGPRPRPRNGWFGPKLIDCHLFYKSGLASSVSSPGMYQSVD